MGGGNREMMAKGHKVFLGSDKSGLKLIVVVVVQL